MSPRRIAGTGRMVLLAVLICAAPALALTLEETLGQAKLLRLRVFGVLESVRLEPTDRSLLEKDKADLDRAVKSKDKAQIEALIARVTADLERVASGNLKTVKDRYLADVALLEKLRQPALKPLVPANGPRIDKLLAEKGRVAASQDAGLVVGAQKSVEETRVAVTGEMRTSLESLGAAAGRLARGNEQVLAEKVRGFKPALEAVREAAGSKDLAKMIDRGGALVGLLPGAKSAIEAALLQARAPWAAAETAARALQGRLGGDLAFTDSGRRIGEALAGGEAALGGGQADALRETTERLSALVAKAPSEVEQRRTSLLADRDAKVKGAEAQLGHGGGALKPQTRAALQSAAARAKELGAGVSLESLTAALGTLEAALNSSRAEASAVFKQALLLEGKARACVAGLKSGLEDLLAAEAHASLDRCLVEMKGQVDGGSAAGLQQAAEACQGVCVEVAAGVCKGLEGEAAAASRLAAEGPLPADLKAGLASGANLLRPALARGNCRGIDRAGLARLRRDVNRARIALALQSAYATLTGGPAGIEKAIESLNGVPVSEDQKGRSPLLQWSLAYFYYLKHQTVEGPEKDRWLEQARGAFRRAGPVARAELAGSGLFPDDFVSEMAAVVTDGS
jgi:hypothetical protein